MGLAVGTTPSLVNTKVSSMEYGYLIAPLLAGSIVVLDHGIGDLDTLCTMAGRTNQETGPRNVDQDWCQNWIGKSHYVGEIQDAHQPLAERRPGLWQKPIRTCPNICWEVVEKKLRQDMQSSTTASFL